MAKTIDVNPFTHLWCILLASILLACSFVEYVKLVEIAMVQVLGNVKDEWCFSSLALCKSKLRNWLTTNLGLVVKMFSQKFCLCKISICRSIRALVVGITHSICYGSLGFQSSNLLMQKLEVETILRFWQPCELQFAKTCWFFFNGSWCIHNEHQWL